jgi:hypothetical protein
MNSNREILIYQSPNGNITIDVCLEEYLKTQNRYAHLFEPVKQVDIINTIQKDIDSYWKR